MFGVLKSLALRKAFPWFTPKSRGEVAQQDFLTKEMAVPAPNRGIRKAKKDSEVDSDGEEVHLCCQCGLPVGETAYRPEEKDDSCRVGRTTVGEGNPTSSSPVGVAWWRAGTPSTIAWEGSTPNLVAWVDDSAEKGL
eukprot:g20399.t1